MVGACGVSGHSDAAGINAAEQYAVARSRHMSVIPCVRAIDDPHAGAIADQIADLVALLTDAIADELVPFVPATWEQLYRSRPQG